MDNLRGVDNLWCVQDLSPLETLGATTSLRTRQPSETVVVRTVVDTPSDLVGVVLHIVQQRRPHSLSWSLLAGEKLKLFQRLSMQHTQAAHAVTIRRFH